MKWYLYLNFFIYSYYNKKDDIPLFSALISIAILVSLNMFSVVTIYQLITDFWKVPKLHPDYKVIIISFLFFLVIINYFKLYYKKKYVIFFEEFKDDKYKNWGRGAKLYVILSIILCLILLVIVDLRNHNFELYFLK
jgi:hypothetical protein